MFTGIIEQRGEVVKVEGAADARRLWIRCGVLVAREIGSSVSIDGVCLTVVDRDADVCTFDVSTETLVRSTLGSKAVGDAVNVETPMRITDEFGGHIVQGHVDGTGRVESVTGEGDGRRVRIGVDPSVARYLVEKGSVTVDGVSLTVMAVTAGTFEVALVPHTLSVTTFGDIVPGRDVNVEVDVLAKYVERIVAPWSERDPRPGSDDPVSSEHL